MEEFINMIDDQPPKNPSGVVSNWEKGINKPNKRRLKKIADLIDEPVSRLLSEEPICTIMGHHDWGIDDEPGALADDVLSKREFDKLPHISKL